MCQWRRLGQESVSVYLRTEMFRVSVEKVIQEIRGIQKVNGIKRGYSQLSESIGDSTK